MSGKNLEERVKISCRYYQERGIALIHKIPTPWNVKYDKKYNRVLHAHPEEKSSVDFEGVWHGRSIAIECKSTRERKRFDLKNVKDHQMDYLRQHQDLGGLSFFLVEFAKFGEVYLIWFDDMYEWIEKAEQGGRKSIPYEWIRANCDLVLPERTILDFIRAIERDSVASHLSVKKGVGQ